MTEHYALSGNYRLRGGGRKDAPDLFVKLISLEDIQPMPDGWQLAVELQGMGWILWAGPLRPGCEAKPRNIAPAFVVHRMDVDQVYAVARRLLDWKDIPNMNHHTCYPLDTLLEEME